MDIQFRLGTVDDAGLIVGLINELAEYEKLPDKITTTEERLDILPSLRRYSRGAWQMITLEGIIK